MRKYHVMACSKLNHECGKIIQQKFMKTISIGRINNEFLTRYYVDKFPEEVEEAKQIIKRVENDNSKL